MTPKLTHERIAQMTFASIYPLYVNKVEKKGRTEADLQKVITWLTGFTKAQIKKHITAKTTFEEFFKKAKLNPNASKIKGVICVVRDGRRSVATEQARTTQNHGDRAR